MTKLLKSVTRETAKIVQRRADPTMIPATQTEARIWKRETNKPSKPMKTKVLFRMFHGEALALFPQEAATVGKPEHCSSYVRVGQHSGADCAGVIRDSRPAKPGEYRELAQELRRIGYKLAIAARTGQADYEARKTSTGSYCYS